MTDNKLKAKSFVELLDVMDRLRIECPWDREQTIESLRSLTIEEVFELSDEINNENYEGILEELGDLLLHIIFYAKISEELNKFNIDDVCNALVKKLIVRHPHVYTDFQADNENEVKQNWERIKIKENGKTKTVLEGVPKGLPSIIKSYRIQDKARNVGFDWKQKEDVWLKVDEEMHELKVEIDRNDRKAIEEEFGDLLFAIINAARLYNIDPDTALENTNKKFIKRFNYIENKLIENKKTFKDSNLEDMEFFWIESKKI